MNLRQKITASIACLLLAITLTGCGGGGGDGGDDSSDSSYPEPTVIYSDAFTDNADNWSFIDDTTNGAYWNVSDGKLYQSTHLESAGSLDATFADSSSYHLGTHAWLNHPDVIGLANYRFSVDITPMSDGGGKTEGNDAGIMFGYQGADTYYRVSMSSRYGFTRFEKRVGGIFETLAVNARGYVDNDTLTLAAEINGDTVIVWVDEDPVFALKDSEVLAGTVALYCQDRARFDNVRITENPQRPLVVISSPLAYSVALTPEDGHTLQVEALVLNKPSGGYVEFKLDGNTTTGSNVTGNLYRASFAGVSDGDHEVAAVLRNADGSRADSDVNAMVGVGGDYYVTVGDSITNGMMDDDSTDNLSEDGRIDALQGYQAPLADLLADDSGLPQIVFNEGIPGEMASDLVTRIDSILERHPGANKVLMMIGTNDAALGNRPATGVFASSVDSVVNQMLVEDKQVWLAKTLYTYLQGTSPLTADVDRNGWIEDYNDQIEQIVTLHSGESVFLGPDFYTDLNNTAYYADFLHPNGDGYNRMALLWSYDLP